MARVTSVAICMMCMNKWKALANIHRKVHGKWHLVKEHQHKVCWWSGTRSPADTPMSIPCQKYSGQLSYNDQNLMTQILYNMIFYLKKYNLTQQRTGYGLWAVSCEFRVSSMPYLSFSAVSLLYYIKLSLTHCGLVVPHSLSHFIAVSAWCYIKLYAVLLTHCGPVTPYAQCHFSAASIFCYIKLYL